MKDVYTAQELLRSAQTQAGGRTPIGSSPGGAGAGSGVDARERELAD